jgi:hypothetical protein
MSLEISAKIIRTLNLRNFYKSMAFQLALARTLKVTIVLSPWLVFQPFEYFKGESEIPDNTKAFVQNEVNLHKDLEGYKVAIGYVILRITKCLEFLCL